ncbi:MAG: hypothetical protein ACO1RA_01010 [Planctomycetaceae bacterium]
MFLLSQPTKSMLTWGLYSVPQWVLGATNFFAFLDGTQLFSISCFSSQMTVLAAWLVMGKRWPYFRLSAIAGICLLHWCPDEWLSGARFTQTLYFPVMPQLFLLGVAYALGFRLYRGPESEHAIYHRQWRTRDLLLVLLVIPLMMANCAYWYGQLVKPISPSSETKGLWQPAYWLTGLVDGEILGQFLATAVIYNYHLAFYSTLLMGVALLVGRRPWLFPVVVMIVNLLLAFTWLIPNSDPILTSLVTSTAWQLAALCSHCLLLPPMGLTWGQAQAAQSHPLKNQPLVV